MKIFSLIRRQMTPLFALRYLLLARPNSKEPAMSRKIQFACLFVLLGLLSAAAQSGFAQNASAQNTNPLNFGNNFFVTGDYVVAGAQGMNSSFTTINGNSYAIGTIKIPDGNPGIRGTTSVPKGAQIVAALLYWQTVEKIGVKPGGPGSGQNGFFRPVFTVPPPAGQLTPYPITGVNQSNQNTVSFSNGGCTGTSTGKALQTYRADVRSFLPRDKDGNVLVDSTDGVTFEVRLPGTGSTTPITLGATLVLIYRVLSPAIPLNSIVIYDGDFAPGGTLLNMSQTVKGFYQAAQTPVSRLTHIVGQGKSNKFQTVYLNGMQRSPVPLPSPYGKNQPAFPGWYGSWDNTTWTFPDPTFPDPKYPPNPVHENDDSATTMVAPSGSQMGCVSWGAVIVSTTVHDDDKDGILQVWKQHQGYTDVGTGQPVSLVDSNDPVNTGLPRQDVFIQLDHVVDPTGDYTPKPGVESMVHDAFLANNHNIHLHITDKYAIQESECTDNLNASPPQLCSYPKQLPNQPNQPGITTWPDGFEFLKNQLVDSSGNVCSSPPAPSCTPRFPIAQRNSHHYVVFGDALGAANWGLLGGTLMDTTGAGIGAGGGVVVQSGSTGNNAGNTVTFKTSTAHGLKVDHVAGNGRVTITGAISNPSLNGTYWVKSVQCPNIDCSLSNKAPGPYTFTIDIGGNPILFNYTRFTDPNLAVASGLAGTGSGFSYVAGSGTLVTLGLWKEKNNVRSQAGTFMHELGHTLGLQHGGGDSTNCKSNYQSVMNYMFQTASLGPNGVVDFSNQQLSDLDETNLGTLTTTDNSIAFSTTSWYDTKQTFVSATITSFAIASNVVTFQAVNGFAPGDMVKITGLTIGTYLNGQVLTVIATGLSGTQFEANSTNGNVLSTADSGTAVKALGSAATHHCSGTPLSIADPPTYFYQGGTTPLPNELVIPWSITSNPGLDIDFDGKTPGSEGLFHGYDDWANTDPRQVGASGSVLLGPGGLFTGPGGLFTGPGGLFTGPGGLFTGPGAFFTGPGGLFTGPGGLFTGPGGLFTGPGASGGEIDLATAISVVHAPGTLTATEDPSPRIIHLSWTAPTLFDSFNIYRSSDNGATFSFLKNVSGSPTTDNVTCNPVGYKYFITTVLIDTTVNPSQTRESTPSPTAPSSGPKLTGCYTNTPLSVALTDLSFPANPNVHGSLIPITWTLQVDNPSSYPNQSPFVNNLLANTLDAIGPLQPSAGGACPASAPAGPVIHLLSKGIVINPPTSTSTYGVSSGPNYQFTFTLDTDVLSSGCYFLKLTTDSVQSETTTAALQLQIDVNDTDSTPHITTTTLTAGTVGSAYPSYALTEHGGTPPDTWSFSAGLPTGMSGSSAGILSGTPCMAGPFSFMVTVTDSKSNSGTLGLNLQINKANTTTGVMSNANPSVFQQMVTFTVTVAPNSPCIPTGTVTLLDGGVPIPSASNLQLTGGIATFATSALSIGIHSITATYGGDPNFNPSNSPTWSQTVNKANTTIAINSVLPSPAFVGQAITVAYNFAVMPPGGGIPIGPSGTINVTASDGSSCVAPAAPGPGACVLSPTPTTAGSRTFTVTYAGDNNFVGSGANGNYTVYQLVFTVQPSNTGVGITMTPAVLVAAQDGSNNTLQSFTSSITLAIGSGPGTLSGTTTQNAVSGVATFNDLNINMMANGYTLVASLSGSVAPATSNAFNIDGLLFAGTGHNTVSGTPLPDQLGRFTINGTSMTGGGALSVNYYINGVAQAGKFLYAGDPNSNTLRTIDFNGGLVSSVVAGFPNACCNEDMHFDAANNVLWHANYSLEIEKLNPATGAVITAYPQSDVVGITFVGNTIWITKWAGQQVGTWDPTTNTFTMKFATPANAGGLAYDPVNGTLWVGLQGGLVVPYDPTTGLAKGSGFSPFGGLGADTVDGLEFVSQVP
jgi:hypothetical protein